MEGNTEFLTGVGLLIGAISAAITAVISVWFSKRSEARVAEIKAEQESNKQQLELLSSRVKELEAYNQQLEKDHHDCEIRCARLEERLALIEKRNA